MGDDVRYRALDASGDYTFGQNGVNFLVNSPEAVAQAIITRLGIATGEWFLDITFGTPYNTEILGAGTNSTYDAALQSVILGTDGVTELVSYSSTRDPVTRAVTVTSRVNTLYGAVSVTTVL